MTYTHQRWEYIVATIRVVHLQGVQQYQETYLGIYIDPDKAVVLGKLGFYGWELVGWEGEKHTFKRPVIGD